ncbi:enamine deaminase RidA (YjgF/YER057c/UK114 family) [Catenuloplanes nepalensis]|uniref:Enamine deaminase RidA (YjgF/YER057c/UK114 family) n=1 Tax=Catenuloplanes nepalensis TaxID=587533 RepID=A0ABT9MLT3_9ACTN|nr:RidA family protein [Catenuloplanes nepalensis]MDP9792286.1 enamine deaminase RidA (YjgF/YER057c/UK114 family) [Catenuloplanes nepalensis]
MSPEAVNSPDLSTPPGYSHAMRAGGLLFVSGQVPFDENGAVVGVGDMRAQAERTFRNLGIVLEAAGASFADLVKLTYFVRDVSAVADVRAARDLFVDVKKPPASSLVEVSALIHPDLLIEIEAIAQLPTA